MNPQSIVRLPALVALVALVPPTQAQVKDPTIVLREMHAQELVLEAGSAQHASIPVFDEKLGVLLGADLYFQARIHHDVAAENLGSQADTMVLQGTAGVAVYCENTARLDLSSADILVVRRLSAFDGLKDADGSSGTKLHVETEGWKREVALAVDPDELAELSGDANEELELTLTPVDITKLEGSDLASQVRVSFELRIAVVYRYAPFRNDVVLKPAFGSRIPESATTYPNKLPVPAIQGGSTSQNSNPNPGSGGSAPAPAAPPAASAPPSLWSGMVSNDVINRNIRRLP